MTWGDLFLYLSQHPVLSLGLLAFLIATRMAVFTKAGRPFWAALIPLYAEWTFAKVAGAPGVLGLLLWVPVVNLFAWLGLNMGLAKRFGRSPLFGLGLTFVNPVFMPMLAFGRSRYRLLP